MGRQIQIHSRDTCGTPNAAYLEFKIYLMAPKEYSPLHGIVWPGLGSYVGLSTERT